MRQKHRKRQGAQDMVNATWWGGLGEERSRWLRNSRKANTVSGLAGGRIWGKGWPGANPHLRSLQLTQQEIDNPDCCGAGSLGALFGLEAEHWGRTQGGAVMVVQAPVPGLSTAGGMDREVTGGALPVCPGPGPVEQHPHLGLALLLELSQTAALAFRVQDQRGGKDASGTQASRLTE